MVWINPSVSHLISNDISNKIWMYIHTEFHVCWYNPIDCGFRTIKVSCFLSHFFPGGFFKSEMIISLKLCFDTVYAKIKTFEPFDFLNLQKIYMKSLNHLVLRQMWYLLKPIKYTWLKRFLLELDFLFQLGQSYLKN